jgi:hypothetical protein
VRDLCEDVEQDVQEQMTETGFRLDQLEQALFDAAGEQLKGDTTHQSAYSKLHSSQSTPFIGGTSLRGLESGGGMSMSAAERQQQDTTTDGGGDAGSRRRGSANPLKRTNRSDASCNKSQTGNGSTYGRSSAGATRHRTAVKTAAMATPPPLSCAAASRCPCCASRSFWLPN